MDKIRGRIESIIAPVYDIEFCYGGSRIPLEDSANSTCTISDPLAVTDVANGFEPYTISEKPPKQWSYEHEYEQKP